MGSSNGVVPIGVDNQQALHALTRKYGEISGKIGKARLALQKLTAELEHIDAAIRIFDPTISIRKIRAKNVSRRDPRFKGEMTRIVLDVLRDASMPPTPREITQHLMAARGLAPEDRELFDVVLKRVRACLRAQRIHGLIRPLATTGLAQGWEIVE